MKNESKIETGIPMPKVKEKQEGKTATLRLMKIGDSIIIDDASARSHNGWRSCARSMGAKVSMRQLEDGRSRMWRTS